MTRLNPEHFFEQADRLISSPPTGRPRQVDLRRAISGAYYGLFHFCLRTAADEFVGTTQHLTTRYALVYRSIEHRTLKEVCIEARKQTPSVRYAPYVPKGGFGVDIQAFATATVELQEQRHLADYNPQPQFRSSDAELVVDTARNAIGRFQRATDESRKMFLTLLLCPPR